MQLSLRISDELAKRIRARADRAGRSVNSWIALVLEAAVDPDLAGSEVERTRERLARAGLLVSSPKQVGRPDRQAVERARKAAGSGTELGAIVTETRR